jgi:hypothetical protein
MKLNQRISIQSGFSNNNNNTRVYNSNLYGQNRINIINNNIDYSNQNYNNDQQLLRNINISTNNQIVKNLENSTNINDHVDDVNEAIENNFSNKNTNYKKIPRDANKNKNNDINMFTKIPYNTIINKNIHNYSLNQNINNQTKNLRQIFKYKNDFKIPNNNTYNSINDLKIAQKFSTINDSISINNKNIQNGKMYKNSIISNKPKILFNNIKKCITQTISPISTKKKNIFDNLNKNPTLQKVIVMKIIKGSSLNVNKVNKKPYHNSFKTLQKTKVVNESNYNLKNNHSEKNINIKIENNNNVPYNFSKIYNNDTNYTTFNYKKSPNDNTYDNVDNYLNYRKKNINKI